MLRSPRRFAPLAVAALLATLGCSSATKLRSAPVRDTFFHVDHRLKYGFTLEDLQRLDWYVNKNVTVTGVREEAPSGAGGTARLQALRVGRLREMGPNWLRVAFDKSSPGAYFVTHGTRENDTYVLATPVGEPAEDGTLQFVTVNSEADKALRIGDDTFTVIEGADARLLVGQSMLRQLMRNRNVGRPQQDKQ